MDNQNGFNLSDLQNKKRENSREKMGREKTAKKKPQVVGIFSQNK
jgi:hypothetical protein